MANKIKFRKNSLRLKGYDYSNPGYYFITICTNNRKSILCSISDGTILLTDVGTMVQEVLFQLPKFFSGVVIDKHTIMPNHVHFIVKLENENVGVESISTLAKGKYSREDDSEDKKTEFKTEIDYRADTGSAPTMNANEGLFNIIQTYKRYTTAEYTKNILEKNWPRYNRRFWQRNYFEHIIKNESSYEKISEYIVNNHLRWDEDCLNPDNKN